MCMADLRLWGRLVLFPSLFILTGLSQNFDVPDARHPGRGQLGGSIRRYCPYCGVPLSRLPGNVLACDDDGVISEDEALNSPPPES